MGIYDRDYTQEHNSASGRYAPQMHMTFPSVTPVVKVLLVINIAVFFLQSVHPGLDRFIRDWFSVRPLNAALTLQIWRLLTYQFLHADIWHIVFNMLGLYFLGPTLERYWGSRRFVGFYLGCGVVGGLCYTMLAAAGWLTLAPMVGASGAILGMLAACAIMFPQIVVVLLIFPVPIRLAAIILIFIAAFTIIGRGFNAGGEAAHFGGMAAGAMYVWSQSWRDRLYARAAMHLWERHLARQRDLQVEVDRILQKVHESGIHSLTSKEKAVLQKATEAEQRRTR